MAYNERRGPNMHQYLANLNEIPSDDMQVGMENYNYDAGDLDLFTNTTFLGGFGADMNSVDFGVDGHMGDMSAHDEIDMKALDFTSGDFNFSDFAAFPQAQGYVHDGLPIVDAAPSVQTQSVHAGSSADSSPPHGVTSPMTGEKRKADTSPAADDFEDVSRLAAEEDKRRRNTAASARFRVKKKQREQALERSAKEMADKVANFEKRINQLETENKWLKNLVMERNESKEDINTMYKRYQSEQSDRKGTERKDGVGTTSES